MIALSLLPRSRASGYHTLTAMQRGTCGCARPCGLPLNAKKLLDRPMIEQALMRVSDGAGLSASEMHDVISSIMRGECSEVQIGSLLTALRVRGESVEELVGTVQAMLE